MKKIPFSWPVGIAVVFILSATSGAILGSLWFLQALGRGESTPVYSVGYYDRDVQVTPLAQNIRNHYASFLPETMDAFNRFVYSKGDQAEYIAGIPKLTRQFSVVQELRQQSWQVRRIGWIIVANRGASSGDRRLGFSTLSRALGETLSNVFFERLPIRPRAIVQWDNVAGEAAAIYLEIQGSAFHMVIERNSAQFVSGKEDRFTKQVGDSETSFFALQRDMLPLIHTGFATAVESKVSESMRFIKTQPRIVENLLAASPTLYIAAKEDAFAVGVESHNDTIASLFHKWMNLEQGTRHPKTQSFRLPDKTIGYEYIPGNSSATFSLRKGQRNCLPSEGYDEQLFLCGKGAFLVLSNDENIGSTLLTSLVDAPVSQRGVVQGSLLDSIGLAPRFEKIEYVMMGNSIEVWADGQKK